MRSFFAILITSIFASFSFPLFAISNSLGAGVGVQVYDASKPLSKADFLMHTEVGFGLSNYFDLISAFDLSIAGVGKAPGSDKTQLFFLGNLTESARLTLPFFQNRLKVSFESGGGLYIARHSQPRLPQQGLRAGGMLVGGPVIQFAPLLRSKYRWNDLFFQVRSIYSHYFGVRFLDRTLGLTLGFGGSF